MKTAAKVWLAIGIILVLVGIAGLGAVMAMNNWDFLSLGAGEYENRTVNIEEDFQNILIETDTADISFVHSPDGDCRVELSESKKEKHEVSAENGTLKVKVVRPAKWYDRINLLPAKTPVIKVYLPGEKYGKLEIKESTGDISIPEDFTFESIDIAASTGDTECGASAEKGIRIALSTGKLVLKNISAEELLLTTSTGRISVESASVKNGVNIAVSTGKVSLSSLACKNLNTVGNTGSLLMENVIAEEKISIERSTGKVRFTDCDAGEIYVKTDTGDVEGTLLTEKVFLVKTDTGSIDVPDSVNGGRCEIRTDTGDISIKIK